eukprot:5177743-Amphidinium_carterae.1
MMTLALGSHMKPGCGCQPSSHPGQPSSRTLQLRTWHPTSPSRSPSFLQGAKKKSQSGSLPCPSRNDCKTDSWRIREALGKWVRLISCPVVEVRCKASATTL